MTELEATQELNLIPDSETVFGPRRRIAFDKMIDRQQELTRIKKQCEEELGYTEPNTGKRHPGLNDKIQSWLADHDTKTIMSQGQRVTLCQGRHSHLSKEKLIESGVAASIIVAATKTTEYIYLLVTKPKK